MYTYRSNILFILFITLSELEIPECSQQISPKIKSVLMKEKQQFLWEHVEKKNIFSYLFSEWQHIGQIFVIFGKHYMRSGFVFEVELRKRTIIHSPVVFHQKVYVCSKYVLNRCHSSTFHVYIGRRRYALLYIPIM